MSSNQKPINISSDSESSSQESENHMPPPPWLKPYRPPQFGMRTKEQAKKYKHDTNAPILKSLATIKRIPQPKINKTKSDHPSGTPSTPQTMPMPSQPSSNPPRPSYGLINELPEALNQALTQALKKFPKSQLSGPSRKSRTIPSRPTRSSQPSHPSTSKPSPTGRRVVIGLVASKVWVRANQSIGLNRTMPSSEALSEALSKFARDQEEEEQRKQHRNDKAKGKRPME